jgi:pyruvate dehydrogenase E2 component (dihydrolipoamide acetyltransferase)
MVEFRMPSLGADMEAGTLVEWMVKPGDWVKRGDVIAVVETQKGAIEIETYQSGQIEKMLVALDSKVPVGTPLARIRSDDEGKPGAAAIPLQPAAPAIVPVAAPAPAIAPATGSAGKRASPAARRLAEAKGVDLALVTGSGPEGAITYGDVERRIGEGGAPAQGKRPPALDPGAMRQAIAAAMTRSKREIPHYYLAHQVDVTACEQWLAQYNAGLPPEGRLIMGALAVKATALGARRFNSFNGFYRDARFEPASAVHVGVAIAVRGGGLAAPALHDTDQLPLDTLMSRMRDLVQRTRAGRMRGSEMSDPTITVSSLGERGVDALYGIIYPPQVAIVGFGKADARPWVVDGVVMPRSVMTVTLSADHRASDGHAGALFLAEIGKLLREPEKL